MAEIDFTRLSSLPPKQAWDRLTDFSAHGDNVPFTTVTPLDPTAPGGGGFCARTALFGIGFDDVNLLENWSPPMAGVPGECRLVKTGRVVRGWARLTVTDRRGGSSIRWQESLDLWGVPRLADPVVVLVGRRVFGRLVDSILAGTLVRG